MKKETSSSFPILSILGLMFVYLKLTNQIDWDWFYVTMPFWGLFAFAAIMLVFALIVQFLAVIITVIKK